MTRFKKTLCNETTTEYPMANQPQNPDFQAGAPEPAPSRFRRIAIPAATTLLFLAALVFPLAMILRNSGTLDDLFTELFTGLRYLYDKFVLGERILRDFQKLGIALLAIPVVVLARAIPRKEKIASWGVTALLVLLCFMALQAEGMRHTARLIQGKYIQTWNVYHYYFGAKYFDELGYYDLYAYTLAADEQDDLGLDNVRTVNDLHDYRRKPRSQILSQVQGQHPFSPERWQEFKTEIPFISKYMRKGQWPQMLRDHGYNAPPFWNTIGSFLANTFPITSRPARTFILGLDLLLLLAAFVLVGWGFGLRKGILTALFFLIFFGTNTFLVGAFLRWDWFAATTICFVLFHKGYFKAGAPFLAYATMTRIFPGFLLLGPGILWLVDWVKTRKMDRRFPAMVLVFALCCALFFWMGTFNKKGLASWEDFYQNIRYHTAKHYLGPLRIGLKHMFIDDFSTRKIGRDGKEESFAKQKSVYHACQAIMLAMFLLAVLRRNRSDAFLLGFVVIFALLTLSRYYWALIALMFLLSQKDGDRLRNLYSDVLLLVTTAVFFAFRPHAANRFAQYLVPTYFFFGYFYFITASYLVQDAFAAWDRIKKRLGSMECERASVQSQNRRDP